MKDLTGVCTFSEVVQCRAVRVEATCVTFCRRDASDPEYPRKRAAIKLQA